MTTATKNKAKFLAAIGDDHTGAGATYVALGTALTQPLVSFVVASTFDQPVFLSTDGTDDHFFIPIDQIIQIGLSDNKQNIGRLELPLGTQFYMKQGPDGAPTSGDLYITPIYAG